MSRESEETLRAGDVLRICESNSLECSGINPCPHCYAFVYAKVLPNTLRAGNIAGTRESAEAALKAYDENWRSALLERIKLKHEAATPPEPFVSSMLLEFLEFKEKRRKFLAATRQAPLQGEAQAVPGQTYAEIVEQALSAPPQLEAANTANGVASPAFSGTSPEKLNGASHATKTPVSSGTRPARKTPRGRKDELVQGNKPVRGEVKQIAAKVAKESLAPGKSHSATRNGDSHENPAGRRDGGTRRH